MQRLKERSSALLSEHRGEEGPDMSAAKAPATIGTTGASGGHVSAKSSTGPAKSGEEEKGLRTILGPLHAIGLELETVSPKLVSGRLNITDTCTQPFKVLHGGVSALVAEGLASIGAHVASGYRRVAGVQLCINHLRPATLGDAIAAEAKPVHVGRTMQVWEVKLWKLDTTTSGKREELASSTVTLLANLPVPDRAADATEALRKRARL